MATFRYSINPEDPVESIVGAAGAATVTKNIELTINQAAIVTDSSNAGNIQTLRGIKKSEILQAIQRLEQYILKDTAGNFL
jgi:hypothetical protein